MLLGGVVIGSTVEAAYYALVNEYHFISTRKTPLMFYKRLDISLFGKPNASEVWTKINTMLGLLSKRIPTKPNTSIRVTDQQIKITSDNITFKYDFDKLFVFDPSGVQLDNEIKHAKEKTFIVLDDFELSVLGPKRYTLPPITGSQGLCKELHFYSSDRVDGADYITDCVVESELTMDQLKSFDYSDSIVRFLVKRHLTSINVNGRLMKHYKNGSPKYRKPNVVHVKRLLQEKDNNIYKDTEHVRFMDLSLGEIIEQSTKR
tara:strand:- start:16271 stop:17053 length:783 start_codon:yes stop_codon:yes gene_type:complete